MPFVRSSRGAKTQFNAVNISSTLSKAYAYVYGKNLVLHRSKIHEHTQNIIKDLEDKYGASYDSEWKRIYIRTAIIRELTSNANRDIQEAYLELNPHENTERGRYQKHIFNEDSLDPVWNIFIYENESDLDIHLRNKSLSEIGNSIDNKTQKPKKKRVKKIQISKRRSDWIEWWKSLSLDIKSPLDFNQFEKNILNYNDTLSYDSNGWWDFWQNVIFNSLKDDPRLYHLLRVAQMRKNKSLISGQDWLDGTGLNTYEGEQTEPFHLMGQKYSDSLYRALWRNYIQKLTLVPGMNTMFVKLFDLDMLAKELQPSRDQIIDWRGYQYLEQGGCLWPIPSNTVWNISGYNLVTKEDAKEPPQWAWMRLAMALAMEENDKNLAAINFYNLLSRLAILPTETLLREAGKQNPNFLEDKSTRIPDRFEPIWDGIHQAAVGTKWTGAVTLDWREVRSEGAPISGGIRKSKGVIPFLNTINQALYAQGREEDDRPVTITIPIWHLESRFLISARNEELNRIQPVIIISDLFMKRVRSGGDWTFFDPSIFPEILSETEESYTLAESKIKERRKEFPKSFKTVKAYKVWTKILTCMKHGTPYISFEDSTKSFDLFSKDAPATLGLDGIGSFPLLPTNKNEKLSWTAWPSMAVNLDVCLGRHGQPDMERLKVMVSVALRMLDNCISATNHNMKSVDSFRSVCLGAVGFYEAISKAVKNSKNKDDDLEKWMGSLAEAWAFTITQADLDLVNERGPASYYINNRNIEVFNPIRSIEKLRKSHDGALSIQVNKDSLEQWKILNQNIIKHGQRFVAKSVWAPFRSVAAIAGVSPGGIGSIMPAEKIYDNKGIPRWVPTPLLIKSIDNNPENIKEYRQTIRFPNKHKKWAKDIQILSNPNEEAWRSLMKQGALVRPWLDQGIALTLPTGIEKGQLNTLIEQAWWSGISSVRFETIQNIIDNYEQDIDNFIKDDGLDN